MKFLLSLFAVVAFLNFQPVYSQVTVSGANSGNGSHSSLSLAFNAINGGTQTGANIIILITANVSETLTGAFLNAGAWNSVTINPSGGAARTVSGNIAGPLVNLNGADNVTIDGLNSSGNSLTFSNSSTSNSSGASTILFQNDATGNVVTRCNINGSTTSGAGGNAANIIFGSGSPVTGNDNNIISFCNIGPTGSNLPSQCILSAGTISSPARNNSGDTIRNCNIFNYFSATLGSAGVYLGIGTADIVVKDNRLYQTVARTQTSGATHYGIAVSNTSGNNFTISGNTIGYSALAGTGTYSISGPANLKFYPVYVSAGTTTPSGIQGNIIRNILVSGSSAGTGSTPSFAAINIASGSANIGTISANEIGSMSDTASISFTSSGSAASDIAGIYMGGTGNDTAANNNIGGITASNTSTGTCAILCIRAGTDASNTSAVINNIIGGTPLQSINNKTNGSSSRSAGILIDNPDLVAAGNTIRNLTIAGGTGVNNLASLTGISVSNSNSHLISKNIIYNLINTNSSAACFVTGIYAGGTITETSGNLVHSLAIASNIATISGLQISGISNVHNNMIRLGLDSSGSSISSGGLIRGIYETGGPSSIYFNSIYIGGSPVSGSLNSYALQSTNTSTRNYRNNIFYNARSNSGSTGTHYAVSIAGTVVNPPGLTMDYNIYLANGSGGVFGLYNAVNRSNLTAWQTAVGQDTNSFESNPQFINPTGPASTLNLHIDPAVVTPAEANGINVVSITEDYDGDLRSGLTPVDIGADAGNFTGYNVKVSGALAGNGVYATLSSAFTAINAGVQTSSNILIRIRGNVTESSAGAILNSGAWSGLRIEPTGGGARVISGNANPGVPLITLNGADKVTIDGLDAGGNSLTISNSSIFSVTNTSTIKFQADAVNNKITNCTILGSSTVSTGLSGGNITFGTGTVTGNDNNVISHCRLGPAGGNLPSQCISSLGSSLDTASNNSRDTVRDCSFYDYFRGASPSTGIMIGSGTLDFVIRNNKFYQTSPRALLTSASHTAIEVFNGNNIKIENNTIGYSSDSASGTYSVTGFANSRFYPISVNTNSVNSVSISGNIIKNISLSGTFGAVSIQSFAAIYSVAGTLNISGNVIGSMSDTASISFTTNSSATAELNAVYISGDGNASISNNSIGGITAMNTSTGAVGLYCIRGNLSSSYTVTLQNNMIGGNIAHSIYNKSPNNTAKTYGYFNDSYASIIQNNIIKNLTGAGGTGTGNAASLNAIVIASGSASHVISQNRIYNLKNTNASSVSTINGIYFGSSGSSNLIERNFIHTLLGSGSNTTITGINVITGISVYQNNMISLGIDSSGNSMTAGAAINGMNETGGTNNFYFNSIYIGGTTPGTNSNTFAFKSSVTSVLRNYINNIFYNARSTGSMSGKNYSVTVGGNVPNPPGLGINNNIYLANGTNGVLGSYNAADRNDLSSWQSATGMDLYSFEDNPEFIDPDGSVSLVNLHINNSVETPVESSGAGIISVTNDYDGETRADLTPVDIGADAGDFMPMNLPKSLDLKVLVQGFYNSSINKMVRDTVRVYLSEYKDPTFIVDSSIVYLDSSGHGVCIFLNSLNNTEYQLSVMHRNSIRTWGSGASMFMFNTLTYDFTTSTGMTYGENVVQVDTSPIKYAIYGGDINHDGYVNLSDITACYNDASSFVSGYVISDVTGDNVVNLSDLTLVFNNSSSFVTEISPVE